MAQLEPRLLHVFRGQAGILNYRHINVEEVLVALLLIFTSCSYTDSNHGPLYVHIQTCMRLVSWTFLLQSITCSLFGSLFISLIIALVPLLLVDIYQALLSPHSIVLFSSHIGVSPMHSLLYDFMLTTVHSSRAPRLRVLGIVYTSCSSLRILDSRAPRLRMLVYDVGHPSGDSPFLRHRR